MHFCTIVTFVLRIYNIIQALPAIKEYMQSDSFMRYPINSERAQWVGQ